MMNVELQDWLLEVNRLNMRQVGCNVLSIVTTAEHVSFKDYDT